MGSTPAPFALSLPSVQDISHIQAILTGTVLATSPLSAGAVSRVPVSRARDRTNPAQTLRTWCMSAGIPLSPPSTPSIGFAGACPEDRAHSKGLPCGMAVQRCRCTPLLALCPWSKWASSSLGMLCPFSLQPKAGQCPGLELGLGEALRKPQTLQELNSAIGFTP